jgi:hypothetical protein
MQADSALTHIDLLVFGFGLIFFSKHNGKRGEGENVAKKSELKRKKEIKPSRPTRL